MRDKRASSQIPPLKHVFGSVIIWISLKQSNDKAEELFLVGEAILKPPTLFDTQELMHLGTYISSINQRKIEAYMNSGISNRGVT
jgi:hypothetical protein